MTTTMYKTTTEPAEKGRRAFSQVLEKLREMVISYEIKPGERLNEVALAERLGVSRTPVRKRCISWRATASWPRPGAAMSAARSTSRK